MLKQRHNLTCLQSLLAVLIACACFALTARAEPTTSTLIVVEGKAPGVTENAMEQAKLDALRRAVEQACGTFINAQTQTDNYALVYDKVMSEPIGYIEQFEILEQRTQDGVSICKVRAQVSKASFEREWARLAHTIEAEDNPRCMVVLVERNDTEERAQPKTNGVVQSSLESFLLARGLQLVDQAGIEDSRRRDITLAALNNDVKKLTAMAASLRAEVIILGNADANYSGSQVVAGIRLHRWNATLNIRAYNADTGQILMSNSYTATHSSANTVAGDDALRQASKQYAPNILREIGEAWRKRQNVRRSVQVVLENCSRAEFKTFESALRDMTGVQAIRLRELVSGTCMVEIDWSYDVESLVSRIEELNLPDTSYLISEQTHGKITLKIVK